MTHPHSAPNCSTQRRANAGCFPPAEQHQPRRVQVAFSSPADHFDFNSTFHRLRLKARSAGLFCFFYSSSNEPGVQTAHGQIKKLPERNAPRKHKARLLVHYFSPLQRGFTSCLFSDTVLADMRSEENQYQHSGMYFLKRFMGGGGFCFFKGGIIECSTHCTFDLFNMKREMGTAVILSITLTIRQCILKPGLFAGIVWLEEGGGGIRPASSTPPNPAHAGTHRGKAWGCPG